MQRSNATDYKKDDASTVDNWDIHWQHTPQKRTYQLKGGSLVSGLPDCTSHFLTDAQVKHNDTTVSLKVLIDSGADENLMD